MDAPPNPYRRNVDVRRFASCCGLYGFLALLTAAFWGAFLVTLWFLV